METVLHYFQKLVGTFYTLCLLHGCSPYVYDTEWLKMTVGTEKYFIHLPWDPCWYPDKKSMFWFVLSMSCGLMVF